MSEETTRLPQPNFERPHALVETDSKKRHPIDADRISIGRADDNTICLAADVHASGHHAHVYSQKGEIWLRDLGSSNGTQVNGVSVTSPVKIKPGDKIVIGKTELDVR